MSGPRIIEGGIFRDSRGVVRHVNDFQFGGVDRFYVISPAVIHEVRGWVGHRRDWKWFFVASGEFSIGVVKPDDWRNPSRTLPVWRVTLRADKPQILEIPPGMVTASMAILEGSMLVVFSSGYIENVKEDDFRFPREHWSFPVRV